MQKKKGKKGIHGFSCFFFFFASQQTYGARGIDSLPQIQEDILKCKWYI